MPPRRGCQWKTSSFVAKGRLPWYGAECNIPFSTVDKSGKFLENKQKKLTVLLNYSLQTCFGQVAHPTTSQKFNRKILETRESKRELIDKIATDPWLNGRENLARGKTLKHPSSPLIPVCQRGCVQAQIKEYQSANKLPTQHRLTKRLFAKKFPKGQTGSTSWVRHKNVLNFAYIP